MPMPRRPVRSQRAMREKVIGSAPRGRLAGKTGDELALRDRAARISAPLAVVGLVGLVLLVDAPELVDGLSVQCASEIRVAVVVVDVNDESGGALGEVSLAATLTARVAPGLEAGDEAFLELGVGIAVKAFSDGFDDVLAGEHVAEGD